MTWNMDRGAAGEKAGVRMWQVFRLLRSLEFLWTMDCTQGSCLARFCYGELFSWRPLDECTERQEAGSPVKSSKVWEIVETRKQKPKWGRH